MSYDLVDIDLSEDQYGLYDRFVHEEHKIYLLTGGVRSGKSRIATLLLLLHSANFDSQNILILGRTFSSAQRNIEPFIREYCELLGIPHNLKSSPMQIMGNRWYWLGSDNRPAAERLFGLGACSAMIDEATRVPEQATKTIIDRCDKPGAKIFMTMNPASPRHWIKQELIDPDPDYILHSIFHPKDNPFIDPTMRSIIENQRSGADKARLWEGQWVPSEGLIYPKWHMTNQTPTTVRDLDLAIDPGSTDPYAALFIVYDDNKVYTVIDEYYDKTDGRTAREHAAQINAKAQAWAKQLKTGHGYCLVDPSAKIHRHEFTQLGYANTDVNNALREGIDNLKIQLEMVNYRIHNRCENLISELNEYFWEEDKSEQPAKGSADHALDCLRYHANKAYPVQGSMKWV